MHQVDKVLYTFLILTGLITCILLGFVATLTVQEGPVVLLSVSLLIASTLAPSHL